MNAEQARKKRRRQRQAEPPPPKPTLVRITPDLIERIDAVRPTMIPREPFIRYLLDEQLKSMEEEEG